MSLVVAFLFLHGDAFCFPKPANFVETAKNATSKVGSDFLKKFLNLFHFQYRLLLVVPEVSFTKSNKKHCNCSNRTSAKRFSLTFEILSFILNFTTMKSKKLSKQNLQYFQIFIQSLKILIEMKKSLKFRSFCNSMIRKFYFTLCLIGVERVEIYTKMFLFDFSEKKFFEQQEKRGSNK